MVVYFALGETDVTLYEYKYKESPLHAFLTPEPAQFLCGLRKHSFLLIATTSLAAPARGA